MSGGSANSRRQSLAGIHLMLDTTCNAASGGHHRDERGITFLLAQEIISLPTRTRDKELAYGMRLVRRLDRRCRRYGQLFHERDKRGELALERVDRDGL